MTERLHRLADEIVPLQAELDREIEARRKTLGWALHDRLVQFEDGLVAEHRKFRPSMTHFVADATLGVFRAALSSIR